jgi:thioredoxin-related protein
MKASKNVVCVFVDCAWGAKHGDLTQKYKVTGFPTVVYTDCDGEEVGRMGDRSSDAMLRDLNELAKSR